MQMIFQNCQSSPKTVTWKCSLRLYLSPSSVRMCRIMDPEQQKQRSSHQYEFFSNYCRWVNKLLNMKHRNSAYVCACSLGAPVPPVHDSHLFCLTHESNDSCKGESICINTPRNCKLAAHVSAKAKLQSENSSGWPQNFSTRSRNAIMARPTRRPTSL